MTEQRKKPGRPVGSTKEPTKPVTMRLTEVQRIAWKELGGTRWARLRLDECIEGQKGATSPAPSPKPAFQQASTPSIYR